MSLRSKKEIKAKIKKIENEKKRLPQFSVFGDDNYAIADEQIKILNLALEKGEIEIKALGDRIEDEVPNDDELEMWESKREIIGWLLRGKK